MKSRDAMQPHKKKAKHLFSGKSYNDLSLADSSNPLADDSKTSSSNHAAVPRSHSFGSSPTSFTAQRMALGASYPHKAAAYELVNKCGHGATAEVWRAQCKSLGSDVAIKIVNLERAGRSMDTIIHEAQLLRGLRHPNIVPLLACFTKEETLWMVLPYVQGGSVESAMKYAYPKGLPERVIAPIVLPILKALSYLHKHDIAHRDVKASNILLDRSNILLGDFGTAVEMERSMVSGGKAAFGQYLTRTTYVGTPHWMAPEVIEQIVEGHGPKADIYSFGVTVLEMARGKVPFAGMPIEVVAMNKLHHPSPSLPSSYEGRVFSAEMQDMVAACLQKDPAKRPTAEQLLKHRFFKWVKHPRDALDELLNGVPGPVQRLSSLTRRSTENILAAGDEMASYQPDERVSLKSQKSKEARLATKFDAEAALGLLNKMLSPAVQDVAATGESPDSSNVGSATSSATFTPSSTRRLSFTRKRSAIALGALWPNLPPQALKFCRGILFASASKKGFGLQTFWGHAFMLAHLDLGEGKTCWSGPCYCYISSSTHVGVGDTTRESIVLYSGKSFHKRATSGVAFTLSGMQLADAVEEGLEVEGICQILKDESSPCEGVAFRHYSSGKSWKSIPGVVHVDHVANERLYGKPVEPAAILDGKVPPPASFKQLIDVLNAVEDGKIDRRQSDADSDVSSQGVHTALEHDLSIGSAMSMMKVGGSPGPATPRDVDTAFNDNMTLKFEGPTPPVSSFADSLLSNLPDCQESQSLSQSPGYLVSFARWTGPESDDNDGTPPPDYMLQSAEYNPDAAPRPPLIRRAKSDASALSKGDSALDLACLDEVQNEARASRGSPEEKYYQGVAESFRTASPFASSPSQAMVNPPGDSRDLDLSQRPSKPLSPMSTMLKPPKHPRTLSASMNGLKL